MLLPHFIVQYEAKYVASSLQRWRRNDSVNIERFDDDVEQIARKLSIDSDLPIALLYLV